MTNIHFIILFDNDNYNNMNQILIILTLLHYMIFVLVMVYVPKTANWGIQSS